MGAITTLRANQARGWSGRQNPQGAVALGETGGHQQELWPSMEEHTHCRPVTQKGAKGINPPVSPSSQFPAGVPSVQLSPRNRKPERTEAHDAVPRAQPLGGAGRERQRRTLEENIEPNQPTRGRPGLIFLTLGGPILLSS